MDCRRLSAGNILVEERAQDINTLVMLLFSFSYQGSLARDNQKAGKERS